MRLGGLPPSKQRVFAVRVACTASQAGTRRTSCGQQASGSRGPDGTRAGSSKACGYEGWLIQSARRPTTGERASTQTGESSVRLRKRVLRRLARPSQDPMLRCSRLARPSQDPTPAGPAQKVNIIYLMRKLRGQFAAREPKPLVARRPWVAKRASAWGARLGWA